jgi:hypothetical protein
MNPKMSQITRQEVLVAQRDRYARAGKEHKTKIINELVELFGYHRKAAIRFVLEAKDATILLAEGNQEKKRDFLKKSVRTFKWRINR